MQVARAQEFLEHVVGTAPVWEEDARQAHRVTCVRRRNSAGRARTESAKRGPVPIPYRAI